MVLALICLFLGFLCAHWAQTWRALSILAYFLGFLLVFGAIFFFKEITPLGFILGFLGVFVGAYAKTKQYFKTNPVKIQKKPMFNTTTKNIKKPNKK